MRGFFEHELGRLVRAWDLVWPAYCLSSLAVVVGGAGCQYGVSSSQEAGADGLHLRGYIDDPEAMLLVEVYDHCSQAWQEVQRARVARYPARFARLEGYAWQASWLPDSYAYRDCLTQSGTQKARVRVRQRGKDTLAHLGPAGLACLATLHRDPQRSVEQWRSCPSQDELRLTLTRNCVPSIETIPLDLAGNLQRLRFAPSELEPDPDPVLFHFKDSLLVGKNPDQPLFSGEFRNYLRFDLSDRQSQGPVSAAWISWFSNFETTLCGHREDMGCGYASDDPQEDFLLKLVPPELDPRKIGYGHQLSEFGPALALFNAIDQAPTVAQLRMQRSDVDRRFQLALDQRAIDAINASRGGPLLLGGKIAQVNRDRPNGREWLFVDHLVGRSLTGDLVPKLHLVSCEP